MLKRLGGLLKKKGFLSGFVIDEADNMPSSGCYASRFGSLVRAYSLVGFTPDRNYRYIEINRTLRRSMPTKSPRRSPKSRSSRHRFAGPGDGTS